MKKHELYRIRYSWSILKYIPILSSVLLLLCYMDIVSGEWSDSVAKADQTWREIGTGFIYILLMITVVVAVYVGREFRNKTLNHEIMRGMSSFEISITKMLGCGVCIPALTGICLFIYLLIFRAFTDPKDAIGLILITLGISHIASTVLMWILICKNAVAGSLIAFVKTAFAETFFVNILKNTAGHQLSEVTNKMCVLTQIISLTLDRTKENLTETALYICISFVLEFVILQIIYYILSKHILDKGV